MMIGGAFEPADDLRVVVDDLLDAEMLDPRGIAAQLVDVAVHPRPALRDHVEAAVA